MVTFIWPIMLSFLGAIPLCIWLYLRMQRRRQSIMAASFGTMQGKSGRNSISFRRHIPSILFLIGLVIMLVALARPQAEITLPHIEGTMMLVFDVSASMGAADVQPTRMEAARRVAQEIILSQPETVQIGIVSFSGSGFAVQSPTNDTNELLAAVNRLSLQSGTSLGQGILAALRTIAVDAGMEMPPVANPTESPEAQSDPSSSSGLIAQIPAGPYPPSVIVLLSDGEHNMSIDPLEAAQAAAERDVRIDALGFGTTAGANLDLDGFTVHTALDEAALQGITDMTGGAYYNPQTEPNPKEIYADLTPGLVVKPEKMEITAVLVGASALFLAFGATLSLLWFTRLP